jgi:hypothetical protein
MIRPIHRTAAAALLGTLLLPGVAGAAQPFFATPEAAMAALRDALAARDGAALVRLLGPEHEDELIGGDPAAARQGLAELGDAAAAAMALAPAEGGAMTVLIGREAWPMPIPLVRDGEEGWRFDTEAGLEEINDRRIGRNELAAIDLARTYAEAQLAYAAADRDGDQVLEYAQRIASTPGQKDGLYWQAAEGEEPSPLGPLVAQADAYTKDYYRAGEPYHGYYFKILKEQGPNPPGGAYGYVINGNMIAGFGLVAWPAAYGQSGVMTFVVSHQGKLFEKDLGPETEKLAEAMTAYDPDPSWAEVALED